MTSTLNGLLLFKVVFDGTFARPEKSEPEKPTRERPGGVAQVSRHRGSRALGDLPG